MVRPHNEDYVGYAQPDTSEEARTRGWLFVLADGVGGHAQGEVASRAAVESMLNEQLNRLKLFVETGKPTRGE